jgi:death-on-curing protein
LAVDAVPSDDPWPSFLEHVAVGDVMQGTVTHVVEFGAFIEIFEDVEGLVHISELAHHYVEDAREVIARGDVVDALVLEIEHERRRVALSLKGVKAGRVSTPSGERVSGRGRARLPRPVARPEPPRVDTGIDGWRRIGPEQDLEHLTASQLEAIHWTIVEDFARQDDPISGGVRTRALLESTALRPHTALGGISKYPTAAMAGAALFHSIVQNHAFHDGNKRTALVSLIAFLDTNGWLVQADEDELYAYVLRVAEHKIYDDYDQSDHRSADRESLAIAEWLHERLRRVKKGEFVIQWRVLHRLLAQHGCQFKMPRRGNRMDITKDGKRPQIQYTGDGMDVQRNTVHKIRRDLELDDAHGVDSQSFYRGDARIPEFINRYRKVLDRLAEYDREQTSRDSRSPEEEA